MRVHGVDVGTVAHIGLAPGGHAAVMTLHIDHPGLPIERDARADLRWTNLLGGAYYIALTPGSAAAGVDTRRYIPQARTSSQVTLDEFLQPFGSQTRAALRTVLRQSAAGFAAPRAISADLDVLAPTLRSIGPGLAALRGELPGDLHQLVMGTSRTVAGLGTDTAALTSLVDGAAGTFRATAVQAGALRATVALSPSTLDATVLTVHRLERTLTLLDPLARQLTPAVRPLAPTLATARPTFNRAAALLTSAQPLLARLPSALVALHAASRTGTPLIAALTPTIGRLQTKIIPFLDRVDPQTGRTTYQMIGPTASAADAAGTEFDGTGHLIRFAPQIGESLLLDSPCQTYITDPTAAQKIRCDALQAALGAILGGTRP